MGGGVCGLTAGMLLARDGHEVAILERDSDPVPASAEQAWESWAREGVIQFRQAHFLAAGGRAVLEQTLPDVLDDLIAAGALRFDPIAGLPPEIAGRREGDERFVTFTARRPVIEQVLGTAAEREPGLEVRRGSPVTGLIVDPRATKIPHVGGVRLADGEALHADLVVDAMGRHSQLPRMLDEAGVGGPIEEEVEDSGFIYYGRYFRSEDGSTPPNYGPLLAPIGSFSILTLPGDNGTWAVGLVTATGDKPLKQLRHPDRWTAVLRSCPAHAHWLEGEPMSEVLSMGGLVDRYRRLFGDGQPLVTGVALLADSYSCTNPSLGRGISLGLKHARALRDTLSRGEDDPVQIVHAWDEVTETELTPWYRETLEEDRARLAEMEACRDAGEPPPPTEASSVRQALIAVGLNDADLFRTFLDSRMCITRLGDALADPAAVERVFELAANQSPMPIPGPDRSELLRLLSA